MVGAVGRWLCGAGLALALLLGAGGAGAEIRPLEVVGAVPAGPDAPEGVSLRRAAIQAALRDGVARVARDLLAEPISDEDLERVLGQDPTAYTVRYRLLEDRGERRALLVSDPEVATEYVVLVALQVDEDRVARRLSRAGLDVGEEALTPMESQSLRVVVEELPSYRAYRVLRDQLTEGAGATRAVPVELSAGRAVLAVDAGLPPGRLAARLENAAARAGLPLEVLGIEAAGLRLRVGEPRPQGDAASVIDRSGRNRY